MKKFLLFLLLLSSSFFVKAEKIEVAQVRECICKFWKSQELVREKTNSNDGEVIDGYFEYLGIHLKGAKAAQRRWCGVFVANGWLRCMETVPFVKSNSQLANVDTWKNAVKYQVQKSEALPGDVIVYTFRHVEGVYERHPNPAFPFFKAAGGNTSAPREAKSNKEGVWFKTRLWRDVAKVVSLNRIHYD